MPKPLAFFDIDNTLFDGHSYWELAAENVAERLLPIHSMKNALVVGAQYERGQTSYEQALFEVVTIYAEGLRDKAYSDLLASAERFYRKSKKFFPYVQPLFRRLKQTHEIILVTGEPQFMALAVTQMLGVAACCSSEFEVKDGVFTGKATRILAYRPDKANAIRAQYDAEALRGSLAVGDSEGDIAMLELVTHPYCINPTPGLLSVAQEKNWPIVTPKTITRTILAP